MNFKRESTVMMWILFGFPIVGGFVAMCTPRLMGKLNRDRMTQSSILYSDFYALARKEPDVRNLEKDRQRHDDFYEKKLFPYMLNASKNLKINPERKVVATIVSLTLNNLESAAENYSLALGEAFVADIGDVQAELNELPEFAFNKICDKIEWGLLNKFYPEKLSSSVKDDYLSVCKRPFSEAN